MMSVCRSIACWVVQEGRGMHQLMADLPYERLIVALAGVASMEGGLEATLAYTKARTGIRPADREFQNTRFKLAELASLVRIARVFVDDCIAQTPARARSIRKQPPWPNGGSPTPSSKCWMNACSCTAATAT